MSPPADDRALPEEVRQLAVPLADELGVDLVDVEIKGQKGRRVVKLVADVADPGAGAGLDIDTIARLSRRVGDALDERDLVAGHYTLEVTSPGVHRPLRRPTDFQRNVGRDVRLVRREDTEGPREVTGRVVGADADAITLQVKGTERRIPLTEVEHGKVVLPW